MSAWRGRPSVNLAAPIRVPALLLFVILALSPAAVSAQEAIEYYGTDAIGSIRIVFDPYGTVKGRMDFGPFGEELLPSPLGGSLFAQISFDAETAMADADARLYQPRVGRFNGYDRALPDRLNPQAWNRYSYALNNPLVFVDPRGMLASNCTYTEVTTETGLDVQLTCKESGGGGGSTDLSIWTLGYVLDLFLMSEPVGGDELIPTGAGRYQPPGWWKTLLEVGVVAVAVLDPLLGKGVAESALKKPVADELVNAAKTAVEKVGPGRGPAYGSKVHSAFRQVVEGLGLTNVKTEVSYLNGDIVPWGTPGSVRLDVVQYGSKGEIVAIFDLKTGDAALSAARVRQISSHVPGGPVGPAIISIRP